MQRDKNTAAPVITPVTLVYEEPEREEEGTYTGSLADLSINNDHMHLPEAVEAFRDSGWELADKETVIGSKGQVLTTMTNNGCELSVLVQNMGGEPACVAECMVVEVIQESSPVSKNARFALRAGVQLGTTIEGVTRSLGTPDSIITGAGAITYFYDHEDGSWVQLDMSRGSGVHRISVTAGKA